MDDEPKFKGQSGESSSIDISINSDNDLGGFKFQLLGYDSYQWPPTCLDKKVSTINGEINRIARSKISTVPILRLYGKLPTGHTCVCHIHDIFPYIYIRYIGKTLNKDANDNETKKLIANELCKLQNEINISLKESFSRKRRKFTKPTKKSRKAESLNKPPLEKEDDDEHDESDSSDEDNIEYVENYVADISLVKGIPFYGYHLGHSPFVKISLTNPTHLVRLTKLLHDGKIFGKFIQPFESHVPYTLQFLTDYNVFSMKWITLEQLFWRSPLVYTKPVDNIDDTFQPLFTTSFTEYNSFKMNDELKSLIANSINLNLTTVNILKQETFPRISRTMVEFDTCARWILNRRTLSERDVHKTLYEFSDTLDKCVGYFGSTKSLLNDVKFLRKVRNLDQKHNYKLFDQINRTFENQQWLESTELQKLFDTCIEKSSNSFRNHYGNTALDEKSVLKNHNDKYKWLDLYPSSFQAIEKLHLDLEKSKVYKNDLVVMDSSIYLLQNNKELMVNQILGFEDSASLRPQQSSQLILKSIIENNDLEIDSDIAEFDAEQDDNDYQDDDFLEEILDINKEKTDGNERPINYQENFSDILEIDDVKHDLTKSLHEASIREDDSEIINTNVSRSDFEIFMATQKSRIEISTTASLFPTGRAIKRVNFKQFFNDFHPLERVFTYIPSAQHLKPMYNTTDDFMNSFERYHRQLKIDYKSPFYSKLENYDADPFYYAGKKFVLECAEIEDESATFFLPTDYEGDYQKRTWRYLPKPPNSGDVENWIKTEQVSDENNETNINIYKSQIRGPTQKLKQFKYPSLHTPIERKENGHSKLLMLTVEIHISTRDKLTPDPKHDEIKAIFWKYDADSFCIDNLSDQNFGVFVNHKDPTVFQRLDKVNSMEIRSFRSEKEMVIALISLVELVDPDILAGFEVNSLSWGYIIERFRKVHKMDLLQRLSRVVYKNRGKLKDSYGYRHASGVRVTGRHVLNIWRQLRKEVILGQYSLENVVFHVFHKRIPVFSTQLLTEWWMQDDKHINMVLDYWMQRVKLETELVSSLEIVEKITEQCKLLGCDFYSMIYRGSQFKVECLLVRLAKEENFILISPSKKQVFAQDSLECIPLVMEPESGFYKSPLVVLDFQSLYPSLIIAYNICYSTFLGRLRGFDPEQYNKAGVTNYKLAPGILNLLKDHVNITPNGMIFAKQNVRQSLLSKMLIELLDARILVKGTMNEFKDDQELTKLYDNRQLGLKLIANVTYGYTSATYSGRMPNSDIADAIVSCGRETLLKAIKLIEGNTKWGAKVVYGDTDSLFIYLPGKTKNDAFRIGKEMAHAVTISNPSPLKLKFEKVYLPSVLLSKKRYIGWSYEYEAQIKPKFDAKGIETVRRDGIPALAKILERSLNLLFEKRDISLIKDYVLGEFMKISRGKINLQDFLFAKEVRIGTYKNEAYLPPGARVSMKRMKRDHRAKPQYRERIFYLVRKGSKGEILRDRCLSPEEFLKDNSNELDSTYYIEKVLVPPLERIFILIGINIKKWIAEMPKQIEFRGLENMNVRVANCFICGNKIQGDGNFCVNCAKDELGTISRIQGTLKDKQIKMQNINTFCQGCTRKSIYGLDIKEVMKCENENCGVYYDRIKRERELESLCSKLEGIHDW